MKRLVNGRGPALVLFAALVAGPVAAGTAWTIDWWTLDGGGEVFTTGQDWELSGTIGQWDGTAHTASAGGAWELSGGFWSVSVQQSDHLFKSGFE